NAVRELCNLTSFRDDSWAVVDPVGRFDTSSLEENTRLLWVMPDDPMNPLPLEIFMRDYYEPQLLRRILNGEQFKPIQSIATLNRVRPKITITDIARQQDNPDLVKVTVKVSKVSEEFNQAGKKITRSTDVYDLRLFRDGQIVAQAPDLISTGG